MPLTKTLLDTLEYDPAGPKRQIHYDGKDVPGFGVLVHPSGRKTFMLQYRPKGASAPRLLTLGAYGVLTVQQARQQAKKELHAAKYGKDPLEARREQKRGDTVKDLAEMYIDRDVRQRKTARDIERRIRKHILPALGGRRVKDITTAECARLHRSIGASTPIEANRVREVLHRMFECGRRWGFADPQRINPVADVERFNEKSRDRFADAGELPHLWRAIEAETDLHVRAAFRLVLLTGCRKNEILELRWRDVNLGAAELRLPDTKAGEPQTVPLSPEAMAVLRELPRGVRDVPVFPVATVKRAWGRIRARLWLYTHPDEAEKLRAQAERDVQRRKAVKKHASVRDAATEQRLLALALERAKEGTDRLTIHDLRRSVGSLMALHAAPTVIGKALRNPTAVAVYTRMKDSEARRALDEHGKRLAAIVKTTP
jgi:integrase